jgi:glycosyltransferase involved in cell wall biosynthesis
MKIHRIFPRRVKSADALKRSLSKAQQSLASGIWCSYEDWPWIHSHLTPEDRKNFKWHVEIPASLYPKRQGPKPHQWVAVASDEDLRDGFRIRKMMDQDTHVRLLFRPQAVVPAHFWVSSLHKSWTERAWIEFLPWRLENPWRYTVNEIQQLMSLLNTHYPDQPFGPPPGLEVWDDRLDAALEVEPLLEPQYEWRPFATVPRLSIVIPTHNNAFFVQSVLNALLNQSLKREDFEIILVDDGSTDRTAASTKNLMAPEAAQVNFTYFHMARPAERKSGDNYYRAGIARNLGAQHARGELLLFLDSDILVAPDFLSKICAQAEHADVIQCERLHIKPKYCDRILKYEDIDQSTQTYIEDASYWRSFFATQDWMSIPHFWKYTCTYCLLVKRSDFENTGRFKRTFTTYGFEDVDLGYELARRNKRFFLMHEKTLHLTPLRSRSEYQHSPFMRHQLLSRTAKTFYRQHLDPEIHDLFGTFMSESSWLPRLLNKVQPRNS